MNTSLRLEPPPASLPRGSSVWAYLRDSGGPTQERSVEQQRASIYEYCAQHGLILILPPFEDVHRSGGSVQGRDEFDYMMSLSSTAEKPNGLLIWNFARFSRGGPYDSQLYKSVLRHRGIVIHSLTDKIPEGEFAPVVTIIDIANKQKKDEAAMGAWRGLRHNVKQGAIPGLPPRGFLRTPIKVLSSDGTERAAHRWDPDPAFKSRVLEAFQMKADGRSLVDIHAAVKLYSSLSTYVTFFNNPLYIGCLHYGDLVIDDYCAPTVPRALWDAVQKLMRAASHRQHLYSLAAHPRRKNSPYLLSGLLICARCGAAMNGLSSPQKFGADYRRYRCIASRMKKTCAARPIPAKLVENLVLAELHKFFDNPHNLVELLTSFSLDNVSRQRQMDEEIASLSAQLASIRRGITNLTNAIAERSHSQALLKKLASLEADETDTLGKLARLKAESTAPIEIPSEETARQQARKIQASLKTKDPAALRHILGGLISAVHVDRTGNHIIGRIIYYHIPQSIKKKSLNNTVSIIPPPVGAPK